jgi:hypothetical protein
MRRAARIDANQHEIIDALEAGNAMVQTLSQGGGVPDLLVGIGGRLLLIEVKDGKKPPSERTLTPDQVKWHQAWGGYPVYVVTDVSDVVELLTSRACDGE